jgi:hypothetical protein
MTFKLQGPVTQGYGDIVNQSGKVLGQIPSLQNTMQTRMAAIGLEEEAKNQILDNQLKMMALGVESQQPQKKQGGMDWLGLAKTGLSIAGGLGAFGGGGGFSYGDTPIGAGGGSVGGIGTLGPNYGFPSF